MSTETERKRIPLTYDDRLLIERGLNRGDTIAMISRAIDRSQTTVAHEIQRNWTDNPKGMLTIKTRNICTKKYDCEITSLCKHWCIRGCWKCKEWKCNDLCDDFQTKPCPRLSHAPYCCNSCGMRIGYGCDYQYRFYEAKYADDLANRRRSISRSGIDMSRDLFESSINNMIEGLRNGQSPAYICATNPDVAFSKSTFYRLLDGAAIENITKLDLPRAVRYRPRNKKGNRISQIPRHLVSGRTYNDFLNLPDRDKENVVEMDTVVGRLGIDTQAILTLYFKRIHVQLYLLLDEHTSSCVVEALNNLEFLCGEKMFAKLFKTILCDRGSEFADVVGMEKYRKDKGKRCSIYFTDPQQSQQKGACEKNTTDYIGYHLSVGSVDPNRLVSRCGMA